MRIRFPLLLSTLAIAAVSSAWGPFGHRQVADIAWSQLNHKAKVAIAKILMAGDTVDNRGKEQIYSVPAGEITDGYLEKTVRPVFAESANWPDAIKGGKSKLFESRIDKDNSDSPGIHIPASGNPGEEVRCKTWHYFDRPIADDPASHVARDSNALRALAMEQKNLETDSNPANQAYALYWIEHIYGDLHQPLHCVSDFTHNAKGDDGGNGFKLGIDSPYRAGTKWNLHGYWDSGIDHAVAADPNLSSSSSADQVTSAWLKDKSFLPSPELVKQLDPKAWVDSGWQIAKESVYGGIDPDGVPSKSYETKHAEICRRQALLAGFRLAAYLNSSLGK